MLEFASMFQSGMILQQDCRIPVWGKADPGKKVRLTFAGQVLGVLTDGDGNWRGTFSPVSGSFREYEMELSSGDDKIVLEHILVGEVWICAGQSNMQHSLSATPQFEFAKLDREQYAISQLSVSTTENHVPQSSVKCSAWAPCSDEKLLGNYSAMGYFFARELADRLHIPVGLINIARGGTVVEAWTPKYMYDAEPERFAHQLDRIRQCEGLKFAKGKEEFTAATAVMRHKDTGNEGFGKGWASVDLVTDDAWRPFPVPNANCVLFGDMNGAYWFRRDVEIPAEWLGAELELRLGIVDDLDTTYFNGVQIGFTGPDTPDPWGVKRVYPVPAELVREGRNVIAVRNFDEQQMGGLMGPELKLVNKTTEESIDLSGTWLVRAEKILHQIEYPVETFSYYEPSSLFNGVIAPLAPFAIRGVIWHQGENNTWNSEEYEKYLSIMVPGWSRAWNREGELPFLAAQLGGCHGRASVPAESSFAAVREGVRRAAQNVPNLICVTLAGIGDRRDVHFPDKYSAGRRLAAAAFAKVYKTLEDEYAFGPMIRCAKKEDGGKTVRLDFDYCSTLSFRNGDFAEQIAIAGSDGIYHWIDTVEAHGDSLYLTCSAVPHPEKVRYAWADNPIANLINQNGLRACPFEITID